MTEQPRPTIAAELFDAATRDRTKKNDPPSLPFPNDLDTETAGKVLDFWVWVTKLEKGDRAKLNDALLFMARKNEYATRHPRISTAV